MSYKPAGKDDGIFRPLPTRLFWILIHPFHDSIEQSYRCILLDVYFAVQRHDQLKSMIRYNKLRKKKET